LGTRFSKLVFLKSREVHFLLHALRKA
jgi:hypothetical protein